jgi:hypothetical protein
MPSGSGNDEPEDAVLERLPDSDRVALFDCYQTIVGDLLRA